MIFIGTAFRSLLLLQAPPRASRYPNPTLHARDQRCPTRRVSGSLGSGYRDTRVGIGALLGRGEVSLRSAGWSGSAQAINSRYRIGRAAIIKKFQPFEKRRFRDGLIAPARTALGSRFDDWQVCWPGGWGRHRLLYLIKAAVLVRVLGQERRHDSFAGGRAPLE
jgi:hypothetical protein